VAAGDIPPVDIVGDLVELKHGDKRRLQAKVHQQLRMKAWQKLLDN
jgi:hypothetical protein